MRTPRTIQTSLPGRVYQIRGKKGISYGIDYYLSERRIRRIIGPDPKQAELALNELRAKAGRGESIGPYGDRKIRCRDFAEEWLTYQRASVARSSIRRYYASLKVFVAAFGDRYLGTLKPADLERYKAARAKVVKPNTLSSELMVLKYMLKLAVKWGYLSVSPAQELKKPAPQYRLRYLIEEERERLLAACDAVTRAMMLVAGHTGLRKGELLSLRWPQVDLKANTIFLPTSKTKEPGTIHLNETVLAALKAIPRGLGSAKIFPMHLNTLYNRFVAACAAAGITDFHWHDLRHDFASELVRRGVNLRAVQGLMRHKSLRSTGRYAHLRDDQLADAVRALDPPTRQKLGRNRKSGPVTH